MSKTFHIFKWIPFAIQTFAIVEETPSACSTAVGCLNKLTDKSKTSFTVFRLKSDIQLYSFSIRFFLQPLQCHCAIFTLWLVNDVHLTNQPNELIIWLYISRHGMCTYLLLFKALRLFLHLNFNKTLKLILPSSVVCLPIVFAHHHCVPAKLCALHASNRTVCSAFHVLYLY